MSQVLFTVSARDHFEAAELFARHKKTTVSWWTYAGDPPEKPEDFLPFGIKGQDAEYRACLSQPGEYKVWSK